MLKTNYGNKNPTTSSTQFHSALQKQQKHLAQAGRHKGSCCKGHTFRSEFKCRELGLGGD